jgi:hypothetical protein
MKGNRSRDEFLFQTLKNSAQAAHAIMVILFLGCLVEEKIKKKSTIHPQKEITSLEKFHLVTQTSKN